MKYCEYTVEIGGEMSKKTDIILEGLQQPAWKSWDNPEEIKCNQEMSEIVNKLKASLNFDAINGNSFERTILEGQIKEAIKEIIRLQEEIKEYESEIVKCPFCSHELKRPTKVGG